MTLSSLLLINALMILTLTTLLWLASLRLKDVSIVDLFWGFGFVVIACVSLWKAELSTDRGWCLAVLCSIWGLRLTLHLWARNHGRPEDYRYAEMREKRGSGFWLSSLWIIFWLQGAVMWVVSLPLQVGNVSTDEMSWLNHFGLVIWLIGFLFEAIGDFQLARFKRQAQKASSDAAVGRGGGVMDQGLWRYTRHPNYFGNALIWWGLTLVALQVDSIWLLISPILMTFLLLKVSGVAMLERSLAKRSSEYRDYMMRTSAFIPLPPKRLASKGS
jgi:steroid 5-alpha reductase family enzyme